jgi:hypothetical protein
MKIKVKREGGLMGICVKADINLDELPSDERTAFDELVNNIPPNIPKPYDTPDGYAYEFKFRKGAKNTVVNFDDSTLPKQVYLILEKYLKI